jgi:hypothetical protein
MKKALESKPKRNQKRLTGIGAFAGENLIRMKEDLTRRNKKRGIERAKEELRNNLLRTQRSIVVEDIEDDEDGREFDTI